MTKERQHRRAWTREEDQLLRHAVQSGNIAKPSWKDISKTISSQLNLRFPRNPKQCRERWLNALASTNEERAWTVEDDIKLIRACKEHGHRWSRLVGVFNGEINDNSLKNHFYCNVRKVLRNLDTLVKAEKRRYNCMLKNHEEMDEQEAALMREIGKLRSLSPKLLSKVFSVTDPKQEFKYQAKQSVNTAEVKSINCAFLEYMEDYVTGANKLPKHQVLEMVTKVMAVNRVIKVKYVRESKMTLRNEQEIMKQVASRKRIEKKQDLVVKEKLENKVIPDKKTKDELIIEICKDDKKARKLFRKTNLHRLNRKQPHGKGQPQDKDKQEPVSQEQPVPEQLTRSKMMGPQSCLWSSQKLKKENEGPQFMGSSFHLYVGEQSEHQPEVKQESNLQLEDQPFTSNFLREIEVVHQNPDSSKPSTSRNVGDHLFNLIENQCQGASNRFNQSGYFDFNAEQQLFDYEKQRKDSIKDVRYNPNNPFNLNNSLSLCNAFNPANPFHLHLNPDNSVNYGVRNGGFEHVLMQENFPQELSGNKNDNLERDSSAESRRNPFEASNEFIFGNLISPAFGFEPVPPPHELFMRIDALRTLERSKSMSNNQAMPSSSKRSINESLPSLSRSYEYNSRERRP